jgi:hypothetical protein
MFDGRSHVQDRHPEQTSDALRASAVQYGPRLLGLAADLKHRLGVSYRRCSSLLLTLTGLVVCSAALVRSGHRLRRLAQPSYNRLVEAARHSAIRHVIETGWKIGGRSAWLWVFAGAHVTLYRIHPSRAHDVVLEMLGDDFGGVLVSDFFLAYDPLACKKQKCLVHLLRTCGEIERSKTDEGEPNVLDRFGPAGVRVVARAVGPGRGPHSSRARNRPSTRQREPLELAEVEAENRLHPRGFLGVSVRNQSHLQDPHLEGPRGLHGFLGAPSRPMLGAL